MGKGRSGQMKLKRETILELGQILKEEYLTELEPKSLEKLAYSLVGYFDLLQKVDSRHKFGNSSARAIDTGSSSVLDKREVK